MFADFNSVFGRIERLKNINLSKSNPCLKCKTFKEYQDLILYGNIAERHNARLPKSCDICTDKISWQLDCISKLAWYEENDKRLKEKEQVQNE